MDILRKFLYWISGLFYKLIPDVYGLLYDLASAKLFQDDTIRNFSTNLYLLISVVMLFVFGVQLIKAIVNPDLLTDSKKGTAAFIKRAVLSVIIITVIPMAFDELYKIQTTILNNSLIEKIVIGYSGDTNELDVGQFLSASMISELLYPEENENAAFENSAQLQTYYNGMLNQSVDNYYDLVGDSIVDKYDDSSGVEHYSMHYEMLIMLIAGIIVCYILITACMDMALRLVKLSMLELIAPISIIAYLIKGDDSLNKWLQEVGKTYALVFLKLGAIAFVVFGFQQMQDMFNGTNNFSHPRIMKILIMIGLLTLINELPNLIQSLFGVSFQFKGGIAGRLGNMFGPAGTLAKNAWGKVTSGVGRVAGGVATAGALGLAGIGGALGYGGGKLLKAADKKWNDGKGAQFLSNTGQRFRNIKNSNFGRQVGRIGNVAGSTIKSGGGLKGLQEGYKAFKEDDLTMLAKENRQRIRNDQAADRIMNMFGIDTKSKNLNSLNEIPMTSDLKDGTMQDKYENQQNRIGAARASVNGITGVVDRLSISKQMKEAMVGADGQSGMARANLTKKIVDGIKDARSSALSGADNLVSALNNSGDPNKVRAAQQLDNYKIQYKNGQITGAEYADKLADLVNQGHFTSDQAKENILKYVDQERSWINENQALLNQAKSDAKSNVDFDKINDAAFGALSNNVDTVAETKQEEYNNLKKQVESDPILTRDLNYIEKNIDRVQDAYVRESKGNKYEDSFAQTILDNSVSQSSAPSTPASSSSSGNSGYGPEYYPNNYDDFNNYNSQPRAPRPEATGTGASQPEPTPMSSNTTTPTSDNSTPERVIERETIRENNNQASGPQSFDNVTINASDINAQNLSAEQVNAKGFNANNNNNDVMSDRLKGQFDELFDQMANTISDSSKEASDNIVDSVNKVNETIEETSKKNNE